MAPDYRERKKIVIRPVKKEKKGKKVDITLGESAIFYFDRSEVRESDTSKLDEFIDAIEGLKGTLTIIGHTDTVGSYEYNEYLSLKRARSVRSYIAQRLNLFDYTVKVLGRGEYNNLVEEKGNADRAKNRRVELTFIESRKVKEIKKE